MRFLSLLLTTLLTFGPLWAQTNSAPTLQLHVVDEAGPRVPNAISAKGYTFQVTDSAGNPVAAAAVAIRLPEDGPSGQFSDGLKAWVVYTDNAGIAHFPGVTWGADPDAAEIKVTAAKSTSHAGLMIQAPKPAERVILSKTAPVQPMPVEPPTVAAQLPPEPISNGDQNGVASLTQINLPLPDEQPVAKPEPPPAPQIAEATVQPGTISKPLADAIAPSISKVGTTPKGAGKRPLVPNPLASHDASAVAGKEPTVSITNSATGAGSESHSNRKKWLIVAAVGAGVGVGAMLALNSHGGGGSSSPASTGVSIGTPTISVGH